MSTNAPNIAQVARIPDQKAGPSYLKYTLIGALAGAFIYCLILIIRYLLDDTIHTASDMENTLELFRLLQFQTVSHWDRMRTALNMEKQNLD